MRRWWWLLVTIVAGLLVAVGWLWELAMPLERGDSLTERYGRYSRVQVTRPVEIRKVATMEAEPSSGDVVFLLGTVIDAATREEIPLAEVVVEGEGWSSVFGSPSFWAIAPTMRVITITAGAPGYETRQELFKAHYRRDVTLMVEIPLQALSTD